MRGWKWCASCKRDRPLKVFADGEILLSRCDECRSGRKPLPKTDAPVFPTRDAQVKRARRHAAPKIEQQKFQPPTTTTMAPPRALLPCSYCRRPSKNPTHAGHCGPIYDPIACLREGFKLVKGERNIAIGHLRKLCFAKSGTEDFEAASEWFDQFSEVA